MSLFSMLIAVCSTFYIIGFVWCGLIRCKIRKTTISELWNSNSWSLLIVLWGFSLFACSDKTYIVLENEHSLGIYYLYVWWFDVAYVGWKRWNTIFLGSYTVVHSPFVLSWLLYYQNTSILFQQCSTRSM